ncbi:MAG TPA: ABC transporter permease [Vicinamibacterales bacterium]|nr:ABC transporter permease [Vicinamibacterales bacterium]
MSHLSQDLRFALRRLRQQPGFACIVVLTLAIGLGANTAVFTLVHALILRTLPVDRPGELYRLGDGTDCCVNSGLPVTFSLFSFRLFEHLHANAPGFAELAAFQANATPFGMRRAGQAVSSTLPGAFVTANYFTMFGVRPAAGRVLSADDDRPGAPPVAVISHQAWTRYFGQDPSVVGGDVVINGQPFTIVGVAAEPFFGDTVRPDPAALWIPMGQEPRLRGAASLLARADQHWLYAIGRIRPDSDPAQIGARATAALQQWLVEQPFLDERQRAEVGKHSITVAPAGGGVALARAQYARSLNILFAASAMVLLIAVANLANLLLARADRGQAAIRVALGASGGRLIQQSLVEGVLLALVGGAVGMGVAALSTRTLVSWVFPIVTFVPVASAPPATVWVFALGLAVLAGVLFTAGPAWMMSRTPPLDALSSVGRSVSTRSFVPRGSLVVVQVALSLALLTSATLLGKSLRNLEEQPLGFVPADRIVVHIDPPAIAGDIARIAALFSRIENGLSRVPGVERVAYSMYSPMDGNNWSSGISIGGRASDPEQPDFSSWNRVSATFFDTVGTRIVRGRGFDSRDAPGGQRVAVVNQAFARRYFEDANPIGQTVGIGDASHAGDYEIVGVADDVKFAGARQREVRPMLFLPSLQTVEYLDATASNVQARSTLPRTIIVQTAPAAQNVEAGVRRVLTEVDPNLNVLRVLPMTLQVNGNFRIERLLARLIAIYGVLALGLALLGLYGVTAYGVSQRRREIGVRMALGANRWGVVRTCIRGPLLQTSAGLAIGVVMSVFVGQAISAQLYDVDRFDPGAFGTAIVALMASAVVAAALPARRAAATNPSTVLRGE